MFTAKIQILMMSLLIVLFLSACATAPTSSKNNIDQAGSAPIRYHKITDRI